MTDTTVAADPREKLSALMQWIGAPDCPLELPGMIKGLLPLWLPLWQERVNNMKVEDLQRAAQHVSELSNRVLDPAVSVDEFKGWLPRA